MMEHRRDRLKHTHPHAHQENEINHDLQFKELLTHDDKKKLRIKIKTIFQNQRSESMHFLSLFL
jgi:hypothetical protein